MTVITFWNTTVDSTVSIDTYTDERLVELLEELVTHDTYNNGGQLHPESELGEFYEKVVQEILNRMADNSYR